MTTSQTKTLVDEALANQALIGEALADQAPINKALLARDYYNYLDDKENIETKEKTLTYSEKQFIEQEGGSVEEYLFLKEKLDEDEMEALVCTEWNFLEDPILAIRFTELSEKDQTIFANYGKLEDVRLSTDFDKLTKEEKKYMLSLDEPFDKFREFLSKDESFRIQALEHINFLDESVVMK